MTTGVLVVKAAGIRPEGSKRQAVPRLAVTPDAVGPGQLGLVVETRPKPVCIGHCTWKKHVKVTSKTFFDQPRQGQVPGTGITVHWTRKH